MTTRRPTGVVLAAGGAGTIVFLALPRGAQPAARAAFDVAAAIAILLSARRGTRAEAGLLWWLLGGALLIAAAGDAAAVYDTRAHPPFPAVSDIVYVASYAAALLALGLAVYRRLPGRWPGHVLDAFIVGIAGGMLGSVFVVAPHVRHSGFTPWQQAVALYYPAASLVLLGLALVLLTSQPVVGGPCLPLAVAFAVQLVTDIGYAAQAVERTYRYESALDAGWLAAATLLAAAAWRPGANAVARPVPYEAVDRGLGGGRITLLFGAALTFPAVLLSHAVRERLIDVPAVAGTSAVLLAMVFARLYLVAHEAATLRAHAGLALRQTQFATMAAHELRTPLTSLRGSLRTLAARRELPEEHKVELLAMAVRQSERLARVCADLDVVVQAEGGVLDARREELVVADVAREVVAALGPDAIARTTVVADPGVVAVADGDRLAQALSNLVRNAVQHTPPGTPVQVSVAARADDVVVVEVADTGPGLPEDVAAQAFERFALRDGAATGGFGIGLWIVREVVTVMGGAVSYDGSGDGAVFRVVLPAAAVG